VVQIDVYITLHYSVDASEKQSQIDLRTTSGGYRHTPDHFSNILVILPKNYTSDVTLLICSFYVQVRFAICFRFSLLHDRPCQQLLADLFTLVTVCDRELLPMILTFELDLDRIKMNQLCKNLGQRSFNSRVIVRAQRHTHTTDWTTKVVGKMRCVLRCNCC